MQTSSCLLTCVLKSTKKNLVWDYFSGNGESFTVLHELDSRAGY